MENCRGQAYNGASNLSGHVSGLQTLVRSHHPKALYSHFAGHNRGICEGFSEKESIIQSDTQKTVRLAAQISVPFAQQNEF